MYQSIDYTYSNDAINSRSLIDHFIVSDSLCDNVNTYCTMDVVDNMSDHLPIVMHMSLPMNSTFYSDVQQFISKPKWSALTEDALKSYHDARNQSLNDVDISKDLIECRNVDCTVHKSIIASLYNKIIAILTVAAKHAIPFSSPKSHYNKSQPGWNEHVSVFKDEAINWHVIWKMSGSSPEGFVLKCVRLVVLSITSK